MLGYATVLLVATYYSEALPLTVVLVAVATLAFRSDAAWYSLLVQGLLAVALAITARRLHRRKRALPERATRCALAIIVTAIYSLLYRHAIRLQLHPTVFGVPDIGRLSSVVALGSALILARAVLRAWSVEQHYRSSYEELNAFFVAVLLLFIDCLAWPSAGAGRAGIACAFGVFVLLSGVSWLTARARSD